MVEEGKAASKEGIEGSTRVASTRQGATCKGLKSCIDMTQSDGALLLPSRPFILSENDCWQAHIDPKSQLQLVCTTEQKFSETGHRSGENVSCHPLE